MKVLNAEMYTVIKDLKSERVTLLMLQSVKHGSFCLARVLQVDSWPLSGAVLVIWCLMGHQRCM